MLISIHDVPAYERHLLYCSRLDAPRRPRRRRSRAQVPAIHRALAMFGESLDDQSLKPSPAAIQAALPTAGVA
jgi:hypothetical protein